MENKTGLPYSLGKCFQQICVLLGFREWQIPSLTLDNDPEVFFNEVYLLLKSVSETKKIVTTNKDSYL
jgi:hypothetical protein